MKQNKPLLAICLGLQVLNVALCGTLHQDLGEVLPDRESHRNTYHRVTVTAGSRLAAALGTLASERSHSFHHQASKQVVSDLVVVARVPDDVIEAVEHENCDFVVSVKWHPEDDAETTGYQQALFNAFVGYGVKN